MEFLNMMDKAMTADLTDIDIGLPDEIAEEIVDTNMRTIQCATRVATYLYGDNPTYEQVQEAVIVMQLWFRKQVELFGGNS